VFLLVELISRTMGYSEQVRGGRQLGNRGSIPGVYSSLSRPHWLGHTMRLFTPVVKLPWREADRSSPPRIDCENMKPYFHTSISFHTAGD